MPKISELPLANKLKEEDYIPIVQDGVTKKVKGTHFVTEEEYSLDAFSPTIVANDKAMYKFGEGDSVDFGDSTYDGAYKSAILKGNTLVNCIKTRNYLTTTWPIINLENVLVQPNKKYIAILKYLPVDCQWAITNIGESQSAHVPYNKAMYSIFTSPSTTTVTLTLHINKGAQTDLTLEELQKVQPMIIEYQDGMENWDIPYFTGMTSVKMPVLTTTGKNIFNKETVKYNTTIYGGGNEAPDNNYVSSDFIPVKENTTYYTKGLTVVIGYDVNKQSLGYLRNHSYSGSFLTPNNCKYVRIRNFSVLDDLDSQKTQIETVQLEEGSNTTTYEPFKSNILTVNEPVELRGIGEVQDELNLLTGELTQRINEIVLNGSEEWTLYEQNMPSVIGFYTSVALPNVLPALSDNQRRMVLSDTFIFKNQLLAHDEEFMFISHTGKLNLNIKRSKLSAINVTSFKSYLASNPLTIQYQIETEPIKTVDLSGTPFGYKGGHIIKSSAEGSLLPKFEYEVAVSRGAQISQNTSTLIKHDEKITELLKKTAAVYINQKVKIANLLDEIGTQDKVQTVPLVDMTDSDMVLDNMGVEHEIEIIENPDSLLINLIYDLIELNDTFELLEKVEVLRRSGLIDKQNYEAIKVKLNGAFEGE